MSFDFNRFDGRHPRNTCQCLSVKPADMNITEKIQYLDDTVEPSGSK